MIRHFLLTIALFGLVGRALAQTPAAKPSKLDSIAKIFHTSGSQAKKPAVKQVARTPPPDTGKANKILNAFNKSREVVKPGSTAGPVTTSGGASVKNLDNGIGFSVTGCIGNAQNQTITMTFSFSNPSKVHQAIIVAFRSGGFKTNALDSQSNAFDASGISLGGENFIPAGYGNPTKQLPTGNTLNGSVTFSNVLPTVKQLSLVNIISQSQNWTGGGDKKGGVIEVRNITVNWNTPN